MKINNLPDAPGVYIFRAKEKERPYLYIGKAASLKKRIKYHICNEKLKHAQLDYIITSSEEEALLLEANLIKKHRPIYNIKLRDDKSYPLLKVSLGEAFARLSITRRVVDGDGAAYFGPYTSSEALRKTLRLIKQVFGIATCKIKKIKNNRPCLNYFINYCLGPCAGYVNKEDYKKRVDELLLFLKGDTESLKERLKEQMKEAVNKLAFEEAQLLHDKLQAIEKFTKEQRVVLSKKISADVITGCRQAQLWIINILFIREGRLIDQINIEVEDKLEREEPVLLFDFIKNYYLKKGRFIPEKIIINKIIDKECLEKVLNKIKKKKIKIIEKEEQDEEEQALLKLSYENANFKLSNKIREKELIFVELKEYIKNLSVKRIEAFDISNLVGEEAVGSMVVFEDNKPKKQDYRKFKIKTTQGINDVKMLEEVLRRRYKHNEIPLPSLILIDGGKAQLNAAHKVLKEYNLENINLISLAKNRCDKIYLLNKKEPLFIDSSSKTFLLLQQIRDEAHRFAKSYHLLLRRKKLQNN